MFWPKNVNTGEFPRNLHLPQAIVCTALRVFNLLTARKSDGFLTKFGQNCE